MFMSLFTHPAFMITLWTVIFLISVIVEVLTADLVSVWFSGGAIVSLILAIFNVSITVQIIIWILVSGLLLALFKILFGSKFTAKHTRTNLDTLIGQEVLLLKDVTPHKLGEAKVRDVVWSIQADQEINKGEYVIIKKIEGNKLIVEAKEKK